MKIKNILLLAGGDSTRFWPLENKLFFSFLGKPLIQFQIEKLLKYSDLLTVVVNKNYAMMLKQLVDNAGIKSVRILVQKEDFPGMAGAIWSVKNHIKSEVLVVNGSDLIDYSITSKINLISQENKLIFVGKKFNEYFSGGYFKFDDNEKIIKIVEKPARDRLPSSVVRLVFDYFADIDSLLKYFPRMKTKNDDLYELAINRLLSEDIKYSHFLYDSHWHPLKYPWHVLPIMHFFLNDLKSNTLDKNINITKTATIIPPVKIGANVKIGDYTKINGPVFIDDNTTIGDHVLVRQSHIGKNCLIGAYSEVARSYVGNDVMLHRNYVGDSILDKGVIMGAGAVTANFRFDQNNIRSKIKNKSVNTNLPKFGTAIGRDSKIGVNTTILPGVKIGRGTFIGPHELVRRDLEDKIFIFGGGIRKNISAS